MVIAAGQPPEGTRFGNYRILRKLADGGMGAVYEAQQDSPARVVALKVIRPDRSGPEVLRRFRHEAQMLGRLLHPHIAQIYEAGSAVTAAGEQPFFAMELVRGRPLDQYLREAAPDVRARVVLLAKIADAVQHAHQKGLIHRDLKPANVLVDEHGEPKVLDFGVARAIDGDEQVTLQTVVGQLLGTVPYMSPEQVGADPLEVDTRSDVYALGVLLYESLTGRLPYDVRGKLLHEAVRVIREDEPTPMSSIDTRLRGDLDTIVAKALEKDRGRRYASAAELREDLRRYLDDEPIAARPPSAAYQLRKFARRHRALVGSVASVAIALIVGTIVAATAAVRATRAEALAAEREQAERAAREDAQRERGLAETAAAAAQDEAAKASMLVDFLETMLSAATPEVARGEELTVREVLDRAAQRVEAGAFGERPSVEAAARRMLARTYYDLGLFAPAMAQAQRSLAIREATGAGDRDLAESRYDYGRALLAGGRPVEAEPLLERALRLCEELQPAERSMLRNALQSLAGLRYQQGRFDAALELSDRSLELARADADGTPQAMVPALLSAAFHRVEAHRFDDAEGLLREAVDRCDRSLEDRDHPHRVQALVLLGRCLSGLSRAAEAVPPLEQALELARRVYPSGHPRIADAATALAAACVRLGQADRAEPLTREALEIRRARLGAHRDTAYSLELLGDILTQRGRLDDAAASYRECLAMRRAELGDDSVAVAVAGQRLAAVREAAGDFAEAERQLRAALAIWGRSASPDHPDTAEPRRALARLLRQKGDYADAEAELRRALTARAAVYPVHRSGQLEVRTELIDLLLAAERFDAAKLLIDETRAGCEDHFPAGAPLFANLDVQSGAALAGQGRFEEAEAVMLRGWSVIGSNARLWQSTKRDAAEWIRRMYAAWGKAEQAAAWLATRDGFARVDRP